MVPAALPLLWPLAAVVLAPPAGSVELDGEHAVGLWQAAETPRAPTPVAAERTVELRVVPGGLDLRARWRLTAIEPGWFAGTLVGRDVRVHALRIDGVPASAAGGADGTTIAARVDGSTTVELHAFVPGDPARGLELALLPAVRGIARLRDGGDLRLAAGEDGHAVRVDGALVGGDERIAIAPALGEVGGDGTMVLGNVGIGITVGDAEIRGHARLEWVIRRGELERVEFTAEGIGDDLVVEGAQLGEFTRAGDRVGVALRGRESGKVALDVHWSVATPTGERTLATPRFTLGETRRQDTVVTLARDGDVDVVPRMDGWRALPPSQVPAFARDLALGNVTAAFASHGAARDGQLSLLRFEPVAAPPVVVTRARMRLAAADHGDVLVVARYEVANERASHLRVRMPAGARVLAIEVDGARVRPARDRDALLVPIKRSLETVEGLIDIPVVVSAVIDGRAWRRRDRRRLPLPAIDAPIAGMDVDLLLPRRFAARMHTGEYGVIDVVRAPKDPSVRALARVVGPGKGRWARNAEAAGGERTSVVAADDQAVAFKDKAVREATEAYNANDFGAAQAKLDELRQRGLDDDAARKLQSNLDVLDVPAPIAAAPAPEGVEGSSEAPVQVRVVQSASISLPGAAKGGLARRIREQARARARKTAIEQDARRGRIRELRAKGDYAGAKKEIEKSIEVNAELGKVSQEEQAADYEFAADELAGELKAVESEAAARDKLENKTRAKLFDPAAFAGGELGLGGPVPPPLALGVPSLPATITPPLADDGPHVLVPSRGGDRILYRFELVPPNATRTLEIAARRRLRRD